MTTNIDRSTYDFPNPVNDEISSIDTDITSTRETIAKLEQALAARDDNIAPDLREQNRLKLTKQIDSHHKALAKLEKLRGQATKKSRAISRVGCNPTTAQELVSSFMAANDIQIHLNNYLERSNDETIESTDMVRVSIQLLNDELGFGFSERMINYAFTKWLNDNFISRRDRLRENVQYDGDNRMDAWAKLAATCFKPDDPVEYSVAVLRKFVWQVKRKMVGMAVSDHIMPIISGNQGTGKTEFLERLVSPIKENVSFPNLKEITDSRNRQLWRRWVLVVDEMEGYEKADVDALKNVITKKIVSGRVMCTGDDFNERNDACLIGNSNKGLDELVKDATGMRRFIQLNWGDLEEAGWAVINSTDFPSLWCSVDETAEDPLKVFKAYTKAKQEEYRQKTVVEQWLIDDQRDYGIDGDKEWHTWKNSGVLFAENFLPWYRRIFGHGVFTQARFSRELKKVVGSLVEFKDVRAGHQYRLVPPAIVEAAESDTRADAKAPMPNASEHLSRSALISQLLTKTGGRKVVQAVQKRVLSTQEKTL